jgi:hypothetical protein
MNDDPNNLTNPSRNPEGSSWSVRRKFMFAVTAFSMAVVAYVLWADKTSTVADTAVSWAFITMLSIVGAYVFGASWEDLSMAKIKNSATEIAARFINKQSGDN